MEKPFNSKKKIIWKVQQNASSKPSIPKTPPIPGNDKDTNRDITRDTKRDKG